MSVDAGAGARHVLFLLENEPYPYDSRVRQEAEALAATGYAVTVAGPTGEGFAELDATLRGVRILRYPVPPGGGGVVGYVREYAVSLWHLRRLAERAAHERSVDVVVACNPPDFLWLAARRLLRGGAVLVFDHHDLSPELYERKFGRRGPLARALRAAERAAFTRSAVVLSSNRSYADVARHRGRVPADDVFVVRNGPSRARIFAVPPRPELKRGRAHLVAWAGMMSQPERVARLVDVAEELVVGQGRRDIGFALVGPGDARAGVIEEVRRRGLAEFVELPGRVEDEVLRAYLCTADICVAVDEPNPMNDRSTVTKVVEYMALGRPVVQFPLREMQDVCGDATAYARPGDAADKAAALARLLDDPAARRELGEKAIERCRSEALLWEDQLPVLLKAVEHALGRDGG